MHFQQKMRLPIDSDSLPICEEENGEEVTQDGVIESLLEQENLQ